MRKVFDYNCQIHLVDKDNDIIETLAELNGFMPAKAAFEAFARTKANARIQFREKSRIVETIVTGAYNSETREIAIVRREG